MHTCMNSYIKQAPTLSHRPQTKGEMILIHSFNPDISIAPLYAHYYSEALPTTVTASQCRSLHDEALPATVYSRGLQTTGRGPDSARQCLQSGPRCPSRKYKHGPKNSE